MRVWCIPQMQILYKHRQTHMYTHKYMCMHISICGVLTLTLPRVNLGVIVRRNVSLLMRRKTQVLLHIDVIKKKT